MIQSISIVEKRLLVTGGLFLFMGIILGAFGAHALKQVMDVEALNSYGTGVTYQIYQGLGMLVVSIIPLSRKAKKTIFWGLLVGTILFSFSIYALTLMPIWGVDAGFLGPVTPIGGSIIILTWAYFILQSILLKTS